MMRTLATDTAADQLFDYLASDLTGRGLAEIRRSALGMQLRLTPAGIDLAGQREREAATAEIDWSGVAW